MYSFPFSVADAPTIFKTDETVTWVNAENRIFIELPVGVLGGSDSTTTPEIEEKPITANPSLIADVPANPYNLLTPIEGRNWGVVHPVNAVDIAAPCGTPVYASEDGQVTNIGSLDNWNKGYGGFIEIKGLVKTRYAHLNLIAVMGGNVKRGQFIGLVGNTGNVKGVTGCHLHFEVVGARNPFVR